MRFEINKAESNHLAILLDIPFGKSYLSKPKERFDQKQQTGPTCFYKSLNLSRMRERYGKLFADTHPGRKIELSISKFKKKLIEIDNIENVSVVLKEKLGADADKKVVNEFIKSHETKPKNENPSKAHYIAKLLEICKLFVNQNELTTLNDYLKNYFLIQKKNCYNELLQEFNIDPDTLMKQRLTRFGLSSSTLTTTYVTILSILTKIEIAKQFKINFTDWTPEQGFDGLLNAIKSKGPMMVAGYFGGSCYTAPPHKLNENFGKWEVYGWDDRERSSNNSAGHSITIIGLEKINNQEYIYYLDPNYPITVNGPNRILKMSYQRFISDLASWFGLPPSSAISAYFDMQDDPVGLQADPDRLDYIDAFYEAFNQFRQEDLIDEHEENKSAPSDTIKKFI